MEALLVGLLALRAFLCTSLLGFSWLCFFLHHTHFLSQSRCTNHNCMYHHHEIEILIILSKYKRQKLKIQYQFRQNDFVKNIVAQQTCADFLYHFRQFTSKFGRCYYIRLINLADLFTRGNYGRTSPLCWWLVYP